LFIANIQIYYIDNASFFIYFGQSLLSLPVQLEKLSQLIASHLISRSLLLLILLGIVLLVTQLLPASVHLK
jgi:hypothetical protein